MNTVRLSIEQTYAQIGIQTHHARLDIESPRAEVSIDQKPAKVEIQAPPGKLSVDSSEAWAALGRGHHLEWMNSVYSQMKPIALQYIADKVEDGNRLADITTSEDGVADLAYRNFMPKSPVNYIGQPSFTNVRLQYEVSRPDINIESQKADIEVIPQKPQVQYHRGSTEIYVRQQNSIRIYASEYDLYK